MQIFHAFRKTMFCGHLYDYQCSFTLAMLGRIICIDMTNLSEHEIAWEFHMFHLPMELPTLYHQLGACVL